MSLRKKKRPRLKQEPVKVWDCSNVMPLSFWEEKKEEFDKKQSRPVAAKYLLPKERALPKMGPRYFVDLNSPKTAEQQLNEQKKSRCCGRCDGINDICVSDMICKVHEEIGCRICWPDLQN